MLANEERIKSVCSVFTKFENSVFAFFDKVFI